MSSGSAVELARRRVEQLDRPPLPDITAPADPLLVRFAMTLGATTNTSMGGPGAAPMVLAADEADRTMEQCRLLDTLAMHEPGMVKGPLPRTRQQWIATARDGPSPASPSPRPELVVGVDDVSSLHPVTKPFHVGLFTSTAASAGQSPWRAVIELSAGSTLYPRPWHVWNLDVRADASLLEIAGARDWVAFLEAFPTAEGELVGPDWRAAATFDRATHVETVPAG